jgi:hypothetical protein
VLVFIGVENMFGDYGGRDRGGFTEILRETIESI